MNGRDVQLAAGLNGFKYVNAAELMRYTYPAWKPRDVARFERMLREAVYPADQRLRHLRQRQLGRGLPADDDGDRRVLR